jgi:hypothetical protein
VKIVFVLLIVLMANGDAPRPTSYVFIAVIFIAVLIDAFLLAIVRTNFVHDHGIDVRPMRTAVAKPAPP